MVSTGGEQFSILMMSPARDETENLCFKVFAVIWKKIFVMIDYQHVEHFQEYRNLFLNTYINRI